MTLDELVAAAAKIHATGDTALVGSQVRDFAAGVLDLLAEAEPCGFEEPELWGQGHPRSVIVPATWCAPVPPEDARAMGRMLFAAADEAEGPI